MGMLMPRPALGLWGLAPLPGGCDSCLRKWGGVWSPVAPRSSEPVSHGPSRSLEFLFSESCNVCQPGSPVSESGCSPSFYSWERRGPEMGRGPALSPSLLTSSARHSPRAATGHCVHHWAAYFITLCLSFLIRKMGPIKPPAQRFVLRVK